MTNGDKIRQMSDEDLAERFGFEECRDSRYGYECPGWHAEDCGNATCKKYFLKWLKQEVIENDT